MKTDSPPPRSYRQSARAKAAEETGSRILDAFIARMESGWFEEIRLEDVAADAGVTVQTVIRRFGGKEGLLEAATAKLEVDIFEHRGSPVGDIDRIVSAIIEEYEYKGDLILRFLAQEDRHSALRKVTDQGRADHRKWVGQVFAPWLERLAGQSRDDAQDRLVIALDIYIWKLLRVDMKRSKSALRGAMLDMCACALGTSPSDLERGAFTSLEE